MCHVRVIACVRVRMYLKRYMLVCVRLFLRVSICTRYIELILIKSAPVEWNTRRRSVVVHVKVYYKLGERRLCLYAVVDVHSAVC